LTYQHIKVDVDSIIEGLVTVTLDRPPVNALGLDASREVNTFFRGLHDDPSVRCVIFTGAGSRLFCAGADVKEISERTVEISIDRSVVFRATFDAIRQCPVPTIAALNGTAVGAGLVMASCCDIILAAEHVEVSLPEILVGVMGGARHTARVMPDKLMRYLAFTGERIPVQELKALGQVREVLPRDMLMERARQIANGIASRSPSAVRMMKEAINLTEDMPLNDGYRVEQLFTTLAASLPEAKEASIAFVEKRKPNFVR
jgi:enoyl-CoA hydratase